MSVAASDAQVRAKCAAVEQGLHELAVAASSPALSFSVNPLEVRIGQARDAGDVMQLGNAR